MPCETAVHLDLQGVVVRRARIFRVQNVGVAKERSEELSGHAAIVRLQRCSQRNGIQISTPEQMAPEGAHIRDIQHCLESDFALNAQAHLRDVGYLAVALEPTR